MIPLAFATMGALMLAASSSPAPQYVIRGDDAPSYAILNNKGSAKLYLNATTGAPEAGLSLVTLESGAAVPEHRHPKSAEILYVQSGTIDMVIDGQRLTAEAGDAIYIPKNTPHQATNPHAHLAVTAVQIYVHAGPEQRFAKGQRIVTKMNPKAADAANQSTKQ